MYQYIKVKINVIEEGAFYSYVFKKHMQTNYN